MNFLKPIGLKVTRIRRKVLRVSLSVFLLSVFAGKAEEAGALENAKGWEEVRLVDFQNARKRFEEALESAPPGSAPWAEALVGRGLSLHLAKPDLKDEKQEAAGLYDLVIDADDRNDVSTYLALYLRGLLAAEIDFFGDQPDPATARRLYQVVIDDCEDGMLRNLAFLAHTQLDVFSMDRARAEAACGALEAWLTTYPDNPLAASQWALLGYARRYPLEDIPGAIAAYRKADAAGIPDVESAATIYWTIVNLALDLGDAETVAAYSRKIIVELPRSAFGYEARQLLVRMGREAPPLFDPFSTITGQQNQNKGPTP